MSLSQELIKAGGSTCSWFLLIYGIFLQSLTPPKKGYSGGMCHSHVNLCDKEFGLCGVNRRIVGRSVTKRSCSPRRRTLPLHSPPSSRTELLLRLIREIHDAPEVLFGGERASRCLINYFRDRNIPEPESSTPRSGILAGPCLAPGSCGSPSPDRKSCQHGWVILSSF